MAKKSYLLKGWEYSRGNGEVDGKPAKKHERSALIVIVRENPILKMLKGGRKEESLGA